MGAHSSHLKIELILSPSCLRPPGQSKPKSVPHEPKGPQTGAHEAAPIPLGKEPGFPQTNGDTHATHEPETSSTPLTGVPAPVPSSEEVAAADAGLAIANEAPPL
ncbi:hypothetical protein AURDEDRAFT_124516 [Auricularia subglabra TFB-10046 SS5]|nr:hypothetical protein AURDEDRAFT_124516 [Auricularia subglabra TFB-10046 SS5]